MLVLRQLILALVLFALSVGGAVADVFTVVNIPIDGFGGSVTEARKTAIAAGTQKAANILVARLTLAEDRLGAGWDQMDGDIAAGWVAGIQIGDERRSDRRYLGVLKVTFDRQRVRNFLNQQQIPFVEAQMAPTLIIPVWNGSQGAQIWPGNLWWQSWANARPLHDLTPVTLPLADLGDRQAINAGQALRLDQGALAKIAARYDVRNVLVAVGTSNGPGRIQVRLSTISWDQSGNLNIARQQFRGDGTDIGTGQAALKRAMMQVRNQIVSARETNWKRRAVVRADTVTTIRITVSYTTISQWRRLREVLASSPLVREARLDALSADGALMTLRYVGTEQQLAAQLAEGGVLFFESSIGPLARLR